MPETDRAPPTIDSAAAAAHVVAAVSVPEIASSWSLGALRRALRWALSKPSAGERVDWLRRAAERRLTTTDVRATSWSAVLDDVGRGDAAARAAALAAAAVDFYDELERPDCPARLREQCATIFGTTLVPRAEAYEKRHGASAHVLVGAAGALWVVAVRDDAGNARHPDDLAEDFRACLSHEGSEDHVLRVTSLRRSESAPLWTKLEADAESAAALSGALFSVFFDASAPTSVDACGALAQAAAPSNRCHWHALQIVAFRNARVALVGNFTAGVEGEAAFELCKRLLAGMSARRERRKTTARPPARLEWKLDDETRAALASTRDRGVVDAGGFVRVPGFGHARWKELDVSPEGATVLALRLALARAGAKLDAIDCMVNIAHFEEGIATRLNTATADAMTFVELADSSPESAECAEAVRAALDAHRALVREAKQLSSAEQMLHFAIQRLRRLGALTRLVVRLAVIWVLWSVVRVADDPQRRPWVALDSSVRHVRGVAAIGRFGLFAPPHTLWVHHMIGEDETRLVIQSSREQLVSAKKLQKLMPAAFESIAVAAARRASASRSASPAPVAPVIAVGRLRGLLSAVAGAS